ncbi:MAG: FtsW/RodA/SpoVE family cell cycle protein [Clostridia bacterium]|nr:FtsW/RodA/SpoVE family cell cycle protein [Clostridia bacterium]
MNKRAYSLDFLLIFCVFAISIFGIITIGSATKININGVQGKFLNQILWLITGIFLMLLFTFWDYKKLSKLYIPMYIFNLILLILVLFTGSDDQGVRRWIFGIQPSEFAKIFIIIYLAKFIDKFKEKINNINILLIAAVSAAIPLVLIKIQPSLSASLVLLAIFITEMFIGNIAGNYIKIALMIIIPIVIVVYLDAISQEHKILSTFMTEYQIKRIVDYINSDFSSPDFYQTKNSIWAIGSGQLTGKGLFKGTINQLSYLPESHNDFIFSVIGEEFGFIGCLTVLAFMFIIISRCINIAINSDDYLGTLIAGGVAGMLAFQTFVNIGVATGLLPNTGMPFPFLSYGGSSMWANMIAIGLVLNVGIRKQKTIF